MSELYNLLLAGLSIPIALLAVHTLADYRLQSDKMAVNKSKSLGWLSLHVAIYTTTFMLYGWLVGWTSYQFHMFGLITFCTHFLTDFFTSRLSRRVFPWLPQTWKVVDETTGIERGVYLDYEGSNGRSRNRFFNVLGVDQLIHFFTLALTYRLLIE